MDLLDDIHTYIEYDGVLIRAVIRINRYKTGLYKIIDLITYRS